MDSGSCCSTETDSESFSGRHSVDRELSLRICRVCHCADSDRRGDAALGFLGITPLLQDNNAELTSICSSQGEKEVANVGDNIAKSNTGRDSEIVRFVSPDGSVFVCSSDIEKGSPGQQKTLVELGCLCKNDLSFAHYACAIKWFLNHGSTICEICGSVAENVKTADIRKVIASLKEYDVLRKSTASGEPNPAMVQTTSGVDPDAVAAVRRLRLSEISLWFGPQGNHDTFSTDYSTVSQVISDEHVVIAVEDVALPESPATKWAIEGTGIMIATGLLTVTLAWLIAPRVGKKTARSGLHILLGGVCALTVVVFFRFFVLTRVKYGPARYWAILFVIWFLVFGIWASRTHAPHRTT